MRILLVRATSEGGVRAHVGAIASGLAAAGHRVIVAAPDDACVPFERRVRWVRVPISHQPGPMDAVALARLARLAAGADVVHAHGLRAGALAALAVGKLRRHGTARGTRLAVTLHNVPVGGRFTRGVGSMLGKMVARGADGVLAVSDDLVELAKEKGAKDVRLALIPAPSAKTPARSVEKTRNDLGLADNEALILTVARLAEQKGLFLAVHAASLLPLHMPGDQPVRWFVAGDGPQREDLENEAAISLAPIVFLGQRDDLGDLYAAADLVVSTARWEGQPIALQEAMLAGRGIVATDAGGTRATCGAAAYYAPAPSQQPGGDGHADEAAIHSIAENIAYLLTHKKDLADLRKRATRQAKNLPSPGDTLKQLFDVYVDADAGPRV